MANKSSSEKKPKKFFFVRAGVFLKKNPLISGLLAVFFIAASFFLMKKEGIPFVVGFCLAVLGITNFYIMLKTILKRKKEAGS